MATFYEVKQLLCRLFGHRDIEDNDDDITVELRSYRGECENRQITISNFIIFFPFLKSFILWAFQPPCINWCTN